MAWTIRRAGTGDASAIAGCGARLFRQAYEPTHPEPTLSRYLANAFAPERVREFLIDSNAALFVIEAEPSELVGYAQVRLAPPEAETTTLDRPLPGARPFEIVRFYVDAKYHGQGLAAALMVACEAEARARGADVIWLQAWQKAARALGFYKKMGFDRFGTAVWHFGELKDHDFVLARPAGLRHSTGNAANP